MNLKLIACEIFFREMCSVIAHTPHRIDLTFLPKGLHDLPPGQMAVKMQEIIDTVNDDYDAILLGYGLCNNGLAGVRARRCPLILPRAHDCITLFLGGRDRYRKLFDEHPGTYFLTSGWIERGNAAGEFEDLSVQQQLGMNLSLQELVEKYGEDNAEYLFEMLCNGTKHYDRVTWIPMGIEPPHMEAEARRCAVEKNWEFVTVPGSMYLIEKLIQGDWDNADFLTVPPGAAVKAVYDNSVIRADPC
ncbi:MAG: DUF1638 domain-containing protein [Kiritimatiellales bacterium]